MNENQNPSEQDILARNNALVSKWFNETASLIESEVQPQRRADVLCASALSVSMNYYNAIVRLLQDGFHMPVKALLRILCELTARLAWCLMAPIDKKKRSEKQISKKIDQWMKYSEMKSLRILEEFRKFAAEEQRADLEEAIEEKRAVLREIHCQQMPRTIQVFNKLPSHWRRRVYPRGYMQFNNAVHIDLTSLSQRLTRDGEMMMVDFDSTESVEELAGYALSFAFSIISLIREYFGWDTSQMEREFHEMNHGELDT